MAYVHEANAQRLNVLFGRDLEWEYEDFKAELPRHTPLEIRRICNRFEDLHQKTFEEESSSAINSLVRDFCLDEKFDRVKTGKLIQSVRIMMGIIPSFGGELRSWADSNDLTAYEIGGRVEGGKKQRWQRWLGGEGLKTVETLQNDLIELGYSIKIEKTKIE